MKSIFSVCINIVVNLFVFSYGKEKFDGLNSFAELADDFIELFGEEKCIFTCENGEKPVKNPAHVPSSNGCGSFGIKIEMDWLPTLSMCCDKHDICYDTCGTVKETCDKDFKKCLNKACEKLYKKGVLVAETFKSCKTTASMFYGGTSVLGCQAFKESQEKACLCSKSKPQKNNHQKHQRTEL